MKSITEFVGPTLFHLSTMFGPIILFICILIISYLSDDRIDSFGIFGSYAAVITIIFMVKRTQDEFWNNLELIHNIFICHQNLSNISLFKNNYPLIKSLLIMKQKHPDVSLTKIYNRNKKIFTEENLYKYLFNSPNYEFSFSEFYKKLEKINYNHKISLNSSIWKKTSFSILSEKSEYFPIHNKFLELK